MPPVSFTSEQSGEPQRENSRNEFHVVLMFLIGALGGYLQSRKVSPFEDHKYIMIAVCVTLSTYAFGLMAEYKTRNPDFRSILTRFNPWIGILVVMLMIILVPLLGLVALVLWALFTVKHLIETSWLGHVKQIMQQIIGSHGRMREENGSATPDGQAIEMQPIQI